MGCLAFRANLRIVTYLLRVDKYAIYATMPYMAIVELSESALAGYRAVPLGMKSRIQDVFDRLEKWPQVSGAKLLKHGLKGHYRIRTGDWRVVFHVTGDCVMVDRIDNRKDVYR